MGVLDEYLMGMEMALCAGCVNISNRTGPSLLAKPNLHRVATTGGLLSFTIQYDQVTALSIGHGTLGAKVWRAGSRMATEPDQCIHVRMGIAPRYACLITDTAAKTSKTLT
jgi:hypothetical protein